MFNVRFTSERGSVSHATVSPTTSSAPPLTLPDLDTFVRVDRLGLTVVSQQIRPYEPDNDQSPARPRIAARWFS